MKRISIVILLYTCMCSEMQGQKAQKIQLFKKDMTPIHTAFVATVDNKYSTLTSDAGVISLDIFPDSIKYLQVFSIGYQPEQLVLDQLDFHNGIARVILRQKDVELQDIKINATRERNISADLSTLDLHLRPLNSAQDILHVVPGLFIGQHAGGGKAEQIFLRGFDIDHGTDINITADGLPVNMVSHAHGQGYSDLHFIIPELIDKVSFDKGTYYADKGNFTTAGYVDFRTINRLDRNFLKLEGGQFYTLRTVGAFNLLKTQKSPEKAALYAAGEAYFTKGFFQSPQDLYRFNGIIKFNTAIRNTHTLTAFVSAFQSKWDASGQIPEREVLNGNIGHFGYVDNTEGGNTSRQNASIELHSYLPAKTLLKQQVYYTRYDFRLYSNFTFFLIDSVNGDQIRQKEKRDIAGYSGSLKKRYNSGQWKMETTLGTQVRVDYINDLELFRTRNRNVVIAPIQSGAVTEQNTAVYFAQKLRPAENFSVTGTLRLDNFNNRYSDDLQKSIHKLHAYVFSPKLNIDYTASENLKLYWYAGRGFHSNDTRISIVENRNFLPTAFSSDIGSIVKLSPSTLLQSALWYLKLDQEFVYVGDAGIVEPSGETRRFGADVSLRSEVYKHLFINVDVNYSHARLLHVPVEESYIPLAPKCTSSGSIVYRKNTGLNGSLSYRWMGNRPAIEDNSVPAKGYFLLDAVVNYFSNNFQGGLKIYNILNAKWKETQFITESRLHNEKESVTEIHFTPGSPFFSKIYISISL